MEPGDRVSASTVSGKRLCGGLLAGALLASTSTTLAQQPPTSGSLIQEVPALPMTQEPAPEIRIEPGGVLTIPGGESAKILVMTLAVTGQGALYTEAALVAVTGFPPGSELTLAELRAMVSAIAERLRRDGYFVAQAYLPEQDVADGVVTIAILVGRYGDVTVRIQTNLSAGSQQGCSAASIAATRSGSIRPRLLLLSDLPGVFVRSTLAPGASVGASDPIVDVTPGPACRAAWMPTTAATARRAGSEPGRRSASTILRDTGTF